MFSHIEINQNKLNIGHVKIDGTPIEGVTEVSYDASTYAVPQVTLEVTPDKCDLDVYAELGLRYAIRDISDAVKCIQFNMRLDKDLRDAVRDSIKSAVAESKGWTENEIAEHILDRVFFGDR